MVPARRTGRPNGEPARGEPAPARDPVRAAVQGGRLEGGASADRRSHEGARDPGPDPVSRAPPGARAALPAPRPGPRARGRRGRGGVGRGGLDGSLAGQTLAEIPPALISSPRPSREERGGPERRRPAEAPAADDSVDGAAGDPPLVPRLVSGRGEPELRFRRERPAVRVRLPLAVARFPSSRRRCEHARRPVAERRRAVWSRPPQLSLSYRRCGHGPPPPRPSRPTTRCSSTVPSRGARTSSGTCAPTGEASRPTRRGPRRRAPAW